MKLNLNMGGGQSFDFVEKAKTDKIDNSIGNLGNAIGMRGWNQIIQNGNFADGVNYWDIIVSITYSISSNIIEFSNINGSTYCSQYFNIKLGHKYFINLRAKYDYNNNISTSLYVFGNTGVNIKADGEWHTVSHIIVPSATTHINGFSLTSYPVIENQKLYIDTNVGINIIDLTALFGAGNEPNTAAEFRAMFPADYYPYCPISPEVRVYPTAESHNTIVRGKDITAYFNDGSLWDRINGTNGYELFEDLYLGDYFQMSKVIDGTRSVVRIKCQDEASQYTSTGTDYVTIAGFNIALYNGSSSSVNFNHICVVPGKFNQYYANHFGRHAMNASDTTEGGYYNSVMHQTVLGPVVSSGKSYDQGGTINEQLYNVFGSHLKTTNELLSNAMESNRSNKFGQNTGASSGWSWYNCQAVLMSEMEVYGGTVWSSSGFDTGTGKFQLPLFKFSPVSMNCRIAYYWLKDVASATYFAFVHDIGLATYGGAGYGDVYVRPRIILS